MGTSTGYGGPTTPQWQQAKTQVTHLAGNGLPPTPTQLQAVVAKHIQANGGAHTMAQGGGAVGGRAASVMAQGIGSLLSRVGSVGYGQALREAGLDSPETKTPSEIVRFLVDYLSGSAAIMDDVDARNAASNLLSELLENADAEQTERILTDLAGGEALHRCLERYSALFLHAQFCRVHFERLVKKVGEAQADSFLSAIRDYLISKVQNLASKWDVAGIDWKSAQGSQLAENIFEEVLVVFGG